MAQEGALDEGADAVAFVGVELVEGGQVQAEGFVLGSVLVGVDDEVVGGDGEGDGEGAEDVERGLVGASFVAAQLGDVDADGVTTGDVHCEEFHIWHREAGSVASATKPVTTGDRRLTPGECRGRADPRSARRALAWLGRLRRPRRRLGRTGVSRAGDPAGSPRR